MKNNTALAVLSLAFVSFCAVVALLVPPPATAANQGYVSPDQALAGQAPCDLTSVSPLKVTTTTTTAATSRVTGKGRVRVACSARAFMVIGAAGVTGVTAGTSTGHAIPANVPESFLSRGSMFAFIRDTADGVCEVAECK